MPKGGVVKSELCEEKSIDTSIGASEASEASEDDGLHVFNVSLDVSFIFIRCQNSIGSARRNSYSNLRMIDEAMRMFFTSLSMSCE